MSAANRGECNPNLSRLLANIPHPAIRCGDKRATFKINHHFCKKMVNYRRAFHPGGTYFITINLLERKNSNLLVEHIALFRAAVRYVKQNHPFTIHAWVVLPEHTHFIIELPEGDSDYSQRIRLIKSYFSRNLAAV